MLHSGLGMDYANIDVSKLRVKELKKLCSDAGIAVKGAWEKCDLIREAKNACEILEKNPPKEEVEKPRETVKILNSIEEFDEFVKGGMMSVVAFIDKSQK